MSATPARRRLDGRLLALLIAGGVAAAVVAANAHLVWVALDSQPACVAHAKAAGEGAPFRAARSAC